MLVPILDDGFQWHAQLRCKLLCHCHSHFGQIDTGHPPALLGEKDRVAPFTHAQIDCVSRLSANQREALQPVGRTVEPRLLVTEGLVSSLALIGRLRPDATGTLGNHVPCTEPQPFSQQIGDADSRREVEGRAFYSLGAAKSETACE